jgi:uncharacterized phage-associated protein
MPWHVPLGSINERASLQRTGRKYSEQNSGEERVPLAANAHDVAAAVLARLGRMETMRLQKLVYYSQAWHLAALDAPLFPDTIHAWRDGPVTRTLWEQHSRQRTVASWPAGDVDRLSDKSAALIGLVCQVYGDLSGDDLSELTHGELPWRQARQGIPDDRSSRAVIRHEDLKSFYRTRTLAGLSVADLASGDLLGIPSSVLDAAEQNRILADIREEFRHAPVATEPETSEAVATAFSSNCGHEEPPRVNVRLNRERPQRGSSTRPA